MPNQYIIIVKTQLPNNPPLCYALTHKKEGCEFTHIFDSKEKATEHWQQCPLKKFAKAIITQIGGNGVEYIETTNA